MSIVRTKFQAHFIGCSAAIDFRSARLGKTRRLAFLIASREMQPNFSVMTNVPGESGETVKKICEVPSHCR